MVKNHNLAIKWIKTMKMKRLIILFLSIFIYWQAGAITLVYNMKIRRLFGVGAGIGRQEKSKLVASAVPIVYQRKRHIIDDRLKIDAFEKSIIGGSLFNFRYISDKLWWLEATTGIERETAKYKGSLNFKDSRSGFDDIILSGGYNIIPTEKTQLVFYGLAGFPTKTKVTSLESLDTLVGTRFFSLGIGSEVSYSFIKSLEQSLVGIAQVRFVHFFDRSWSPILPVGSKIQPGNVTDLLFILHYRKKKNMFEVGYNPTFFTNQAAIVNDQTLKSPNFVREGFYFTYSRLFKEFPILKMPGLIGIGFSVANSKFLDTKIWACFLNLSVLF